MTVITRFAPSPTGYLHIGGARTALFNWLFARHTDGKFFLRIEDTDLERSTQEAVQAIFNGLDWLGIDHDGDIIFQSKGAKRHSALAHQLLNEGKAYYCYCTPEDLKKMREQARTEGRQMLYDRRWRDREQSEAPEGVAPVIRFKAPLEGKTEVKDLVQGPVRTNNSQLDDMVLLRSDGTPTYMLSVVADDHDMGVTHAIRGDDHLTNAARQTQLYMALGWQPPKYAHIPLIHGADGAKLSKRHGALAIGDYANLGILPEAMNNYLLRLGWSHGDDEIISRDQAIEWFNIGAIGRSPARFDMERLSSLNKNYIQETANIRLLSLIKPFLRDVMGYTPDDKLMARLERLLPSLKTRANNLVELTDNSLFLFSVRPISIDSKAAKLITPNSRELMATLAGELNNLTNWNPDSLDTTIRSFADNHDMKMGKIAQPLRAVLTGKTVSPGIFDVMSALGKEETLVRMSDIAIAE